MTCARKELVAKTIHLYSSPEEPFVAVNCSALPPTLIESELFGHEKGAFTHALEKRIGRFELAKHGTLFLDEIGELSPELQVKLLRVIQERKFERVGGNKSISFNARIISATNKNLQELIKKNKFREDLFFRLCTQDINVPPLRSRMEDIPELVEHILQSTNRSLHKKITKISENALKKLGNYEWPGNVRELENILIRSSLLSSEGILELPHEPFFQYTFSEPSGEICSLAEMEKKHISNVLKQLKGNISQASKVLGISRPTLRKKISDYKIFLED